MAHAFSSKVLRVLGKYSYGLYLFHRPLTVVLSPQRERLVSALHSYGAGSAVFLLLALGVNLLVAVVIYHTIEGPILRLKSRFGYEN
jgi:peptidoglycan/LPS O-acetylase OafA/YrhL